MKVRQHLWFRRDMETAIEFYTTLIPGSMAGWISNILTDMPNGPAGSVKFAGFTLGNRAYMGFESGPFDRSDHSSSITVECATQGEADRLRNALGKNCPPAEDRIRDPWGIYWQFSVKRQDDHAQASAKSDCASDGMAEETKFAVA